MSESSIKVNIAGTYYPLKIKAADEANIRLAEEMIQKKVDELQKSYGVVDKKDLLSMCLLQIATQQVILEDKLEQRNNAFEKEKQELHRSISEYLDNERDVII
jgi:cell division protein ZapA